MISRLSLPFVLLSGTSGLQGVNVRQRSKEIVMLINSPQTLQQEREKVWWGAGGIRENVCRQT